MYVVLILTYFIAFKSSKSQVFSITYNIMVDYVTTLGSPVNQRINCINFQIVWTWYQNAEVTFLGQKRLLAKILLATGKKKCNFCLVKHLQKDDMCRAQNSKRNYTLLFAVMATLHMQWIMWLEEWTDRMKFLWPYWERLRKYSAIFLFRVTWGKVFPFDARFQ